MSRIAVLIFSSLFLVACGDLAPDGAVVTGPGDSTDNTFPRRTNDLTVVFPALDFIVKDGADDDAHLLADVEIEFISSGSVELTDLSGVPLSNPTFQVSRTDDRGIGRVSARMTIPGCTDEVDKEVSGTVRATVGTADKVWTGTATITCATKTE